MKSWKVLLPVLLLALLAGLAVWTVSFVNRPFRGYPGHEKFVTIPKGASVTAIARQMQSEGVVRSAPLFAWYVRFLSQSPALKAGEYRFDRPLTMRELASKLTRGEIYYHRLTVPEGRDSFDILAQLVEQKRAQASAMRDVLNDPAPIKDLDPEADNLEGYLFPDTYLFPRTATERDIALAMVGNFRKLWNRERQERAAQLHLTVRQVVTLASLIEKEAKVAAERPLISAVFHNRLRLNMRLECDPTVIYAVKRVKDYDGVINQSDLQLDSPYNTYQYAGLPPGPICNPGLDSIDAALYPADVDYLYFVARNDGTHVFSKSYAAHRRAVREYQR